MNSFTDSRRLTESGLGLTYGEVELARTDPRWSDAFEHLAVTLRAALGPAAVAVEHIGSTAVPGLLAKPILDIVIGLAATADVDGVVGSLAACGLEYRGDHGDDGGRLFVLNARPLHRVAHVHVVEFGDLRWTRYLAFRDRLRRDEEARTEYEEAKRQLARVFARDRRNYTAGKTPFIARLLASE